MNEIEQEIVQLAETYESPDEFIYTMEKLSEVNEVPPNKKGNFFLQVGIILHTFSYFVLALNSWNYALKYFIKNDDKAGEAACYGSLGLAYYKLGEFRKAIEYHEQSLTIAKGVGDRTVKAASYTALGLAYDSLGEFRKAIEYHEQSLAIAKGVGDRTVEAVCYTNLGNAYCGLGEFRKAIEYHEQSLAIAKGVGNRGGESTCYGNLGNAYCGLGDFGKAIEYYEQSLEIDKEIGNRDGEAKSYTNLGTVYYSIGDFKKAIEYYEQSLEIDKEIGDRAGEAKCYTDLGLAYCDLGDFRKAIEYHEQSLKIEEEIGESAVEAKIYANLGIAYYHIGDFGKAIEYYKQSLEIDKEIGSRDGEAKSYTNLGNAYCELGDFRKGIEYQEKSLEIAKEIGDINTEMNVNLNLGRIYYESKPELAYNYCKHSIELSEMISGSLLEEEHKIGFYARASGAYQVMVPLCLKSKKGKDAFEYTERSKSRAFLDLIAATEIKPSIELTSELNSLLDDEKNYLAKLREIQTRHLRQTKVSVEPGEVEKIFENLNLIYDKIHEFDPEYVFARRGNPLSLNKIQDMLSSQKRNVVLIEYFITKDKTFIFVVSSKDKELHIETVPISEEKLDKYVAVYWREVVGYHLFKDIGNTWLGLSDYLIKPVSKYLTEGDLIYFVPYGSLHYLPMHTLKLNGEPLIKRHPVAYSPSASLLKFCQNKGSGRLQSCASFGVVFEEEAEDVAELFNTEAYDRATKDKVLENSTDKDIIHFSCHGYFDNVDPLSSGVKLYDDVLTAREIFDMRLDTELVTLSACQTGLNERSPGDELVGLTRAFLYAGSPSIIVSLWSVDARSTQELMLEFYKLLKNGADKATALQEAQKKIMEKGEYTHPYYWAPFVLVGDWE